MTGPPDPARRPLQGPGRMGCSYFDALDPIGLAAFERLVIDDVGARAGSRSCSLNLVHRVTLQYRADVCDEVLPRERNDGG